MIEFSDDCYPTNTNIKFGKCLQITHKDLKGADQNNDWETRQRNGYKIINVIK